LFDSFITVYVIWVIIKSPGHTVAVIELHPEIAFVVNREQMSPHFLEPRTLRGRARNLEP
jgi:hypothetical protein